MSSAPIWWGLFAGVTGFAASALMITRRAGRATLVVALVLGILTAGCAPGQSALVLDLLAARAQARPSFVNPALGGLPVYGASQCVGPVIMGVCQGSVIGPPAARCYGTMLNGQCTGPMF